MCRRCRRSWLLYVKLERLFMMIKGKVHMHVLIHVEDAQRQPERDNRFRHYAFRFSGFRRRRVL